MSKECSSEVGTPDYGEMKGKHLTLAQRLLNKILGKVICLPFISSEVGVLTPLEHPLNIITCIKGGGIPYCNTIF